MQKGFIRLTFILLMVLGSTGSLWAQSNSQARQINYDVLRNGRVIGTHTITFKPEGQQLRVIINSDIQVKGVIFTWYTSDHHSEEIWQNNRLISLSSFTNDNGKERRVLFEQTVDKAKIIYNGNEKTAKPWILPSSLWHPDTIRQTVLLDTTKGRLRQIQVRSVGQEKLMIGQQSLLTQRYEITGDLKRQVWYDQSGDVAQVSFPASDGSIITIRRRQP